jgi:hypothetical protein
MTASTAVRFQRDIQPVGGSYDGAVVVAGRAGAVAETSPGTLVWTAAAPLAAGAYAATVGQVSGTGAGGVPIRAPYPFSFAVGSG